MKTSRLPRREDESQQRRRPVGPAEVPAPAAPGWVAPALAGLFLVSGAAGLVHEVAWSRLLGHVFGATSLAISTVLASYMGGLALGSYLSGRLLHRLPDGRRTYAALEVGIGLCALAVPWLLRLTEPLYGALWRQFQFSFGVFSVIRFLFAGALLVGPTVLMGATLPVLADYLAGFRGRRLEPQWLYTVNLAGAVLGVLLGGFLLMPLLGLSGTIWVGAALNITAGLVALALPAPAATRAAVSAATAVHPRPPRLLLAAALFSGVISLATQVAWTRVLILVVGSTTYAFSTVLFVYLVALAIGSAWASRRGSRLEDVFPTLALAHLVMALGLVAAVWAVGRLPFLYVDVFRSWQPGSIAGLVAMNTVIVFAILCVPVLSAGTVLPLAMIGALPPTARGTGEMVGTIYAVNTIGAIAGAVLGGFVLLPALGSQRLLLGIAGVGALLGVLFAAQSPRRRRLVPMAAVAAVVVLAGIWLRPDWHQRALNAGVFEPNRLGGAGLDAADDRVLYHHEGRTATVVVFEHRRGMRSLAINARINASDGPTDMPLQVLGSQLPLLLVPRPEEVFILGFGSGITVGAALQSPARRVTAVELEPAVVEASRFFLRSNHDALKDPRVRVYTDDARHILLASADTYDVMISEPSHPWVSGVANVFTRDFFSLASTRLRPNGIFAQWLQGYQISLDIFRVILATFHSVFPEVIVYSPSGMAADWLLLGSREPMRFDLRELDRRWQDARVRAETARVDVLGPEQLLAGVYLGTERVEAITRGVPINTDDNMYVEFRAPREMVSQSSETDRITAYVAEELTPVETLLTEPDVLLRSKERLQALISGFEQQQMNTERYEKLLAGVP